MKVWHAFFEGRVQGVGFRFTAEQLAFRLAAKGWVRNLPDGRVELLTDKKELVDALAKLKQPYGVYVLHTDIEEKEIDDKEVKEELGDKFEVRF